MERFKKWLATRAAQAVVAALLTVAVGIPVVAEVLGPQVVACLAAPRPVAAPPLSLVQ